MLIVVLGMVLLLFAFFYMLSPPYHMRMMHNDIDLTPYILVTAGIVLMVIPVIESALNPDSSPTQSVTQGKNHIEFHNNLEEKLKLAEKLLNVDEAKILKIIHENEGITQDSIHFRTGFSHSKISMIMKKLEEKDLIVREKFGKTYKIYLSEWLTDRELKSEG